MNNTTIYQLSYLGVRVILTLLSTLPFPPTTAPYNTSDRLQGSKDFTSLLSQTSLCPIHCCYFNSFQALTVSSLGLFQYHPTGFSPLNPPPLFFFLAVPRGMRDLSSSNQGWSLSPLPWKLGVLTAGPPGKSLDPPFYSFATLLPGASSIFLKHNFHHIPSLLKILPWLSITGDKDPKSLHNVFHKLDPDSLYHLIC